MEQHRRQVFVMMETLQPGRYFQSYEDLAIISGTQEYDLQDGVSKIARVERIAENDTAIENPIPLEMIDYTERDQYQVLASTSQNGGLYYYIFVPLANGLPMLKMGFSPTPRTTGDDIRVHEYVQPWTLTDLVWDPTSSAGAGTADDALESGLPDQWEDLLVVRATISALAQRPPTGESGTLVMSHWSNEEKRLLGQLIPAEGDDISQDGPRTVHYTPIE